MSGPRLRRHTGKHSGGRACTARAGRARTRVNNSHSLVGIRSNPLTLDFPARFFNPVVISEAAACESASPSQPACHSHSFLLHRTALGSARDAVRPGPSPSVTTRITTAGATRPQTFSTAGLMRSLWTCGKPMAGSVRENGRWFGVTMATVEPTLATATMRIQSTA